MRAELIGKKSESGQSTLEMLIAMAILVLTFSAVILVLFGNQSLSVDSTLNNEALYKAQEALENARANARNDFGSLASASTVDGIYAKDVIIQNIDNYTKEIISKITWQVGQTRNQKIELSTLVSDWENAVSGDTCGGALSGDWKNPQSISSIDIGPSNEGTDLDVVNKKVYLTADSSTTGKPDFYVIDVTDPRSIPTPKSINTGPGLMAVQVAGNYAYAANASLTGQLQIIDISGSDPTLIKSYKVPGVTGSGGQGLGNSIFYKNGRIYLGLTKTGGGLEFNVIDVSNPSSPSYKGGWDANTQVNGIYVKNNKAYVATPDTQDLKVLDVSDPANITQVDGFDANGELEVGKSIYVVGNKLYFGRTTTQNHVNHHEFYILNISGALPASTTNNDNTDQIPSINLAGSLNGLAIRGHLAFFATNDSTEEFQIWDISNPASITLWGSLNFPAKATAIDCENNTMYLTSLSNDGLRIIGPGP